MTTPRRSLAAAACALFVGLFLVQGWAFVRSNSQTYDEAGHLAAGYAVWARKDFRLYPEHPPLVRELCALPVRWVYNLAFAPDPALWRQNPPEMWAIGRDFLYQGPVPARDILTVARLPNLLLGCALVGAIAWWAYRLWGPRAAVLAAALAALEPNLVAHASLVGTDLAAALFVFLTLYCLWEYGQGRRGWALLGTGMSLGLALTSKYSGLVLLPMLGVLLLGHVLWPRSVLGPAFAASPALPRSRRLAQALGMAAVIAAAAAAVFLVVYQGTGFAPWVYGVSWQLTKLGQGHPAFFWGAYSDQGWWSYGPVAFLIKTPLGTVLLMLAGLALLRAGPPAAGRDILYLLLPVAVFVVAVLRARVDVGVRYLLPVYPFLIVVASRLAALPWPTHWLKPLVLGALVAWSGLTVLRVAPHHLAYFNELAGGPGGGARYLSDSNIDWGQGLVALKEYMDREGVPAVYLAYFGTALPEGYGLRFQAVPACGPVQWPRRAMPSATVDPARELLAVGVTALQATYCDDKETFRWLRERRPVAKVGWCVYVYDITGDADAHRRLAELYDREGWPDLAAAERAKAGEGDRPGTP